MAGKYEQIAASLIQDILTGHYRVGERLPSERDLAARFDANRGAVREAMKKLEQIGLAEVQPGGARVKDKEEASLDVIGHMLSQDDLPDAVLVDQILVVISSMMSIAADQTTELATDEELDAIRKLAKPLYQKALNEEAHMLARIELMAAIMQTSKNLPLHIISRTLFQQFAPNIAQLHEFVTTDQEAYGICARQLDEALHKRDRTAVRATFEAFSNLNRETMMRAFEKARANIGQEAVTQ